MKTELAKPRRPHHSPSAAGILSHPYFEGALPDPAKSKRSGRAFRMGSSLIVRHPSVLTTGVCVKSGGPARSRTTVALRNPFNPLTWFRSCAEMEIELTERQAVDLRARRLLAWALITCGAFFLPAGLFLSGIETFFGIVLLVTGAVIRAATPLWCAGRCRDAYRIRGCGEAFLDRFPEAERS